MNLEPIMTVADLEAMGPSAALRKAIEAYPGVGYAWNNGLAAQHANDACCAGALLATACGVDTHVSIFIGVPEPLQIWVREQYETHIHLGRYLGSLGASVSLLSLDQHCRSFAEVADRLEEIGC